MCALRGKWVMAADGKTDVVAVPTRTDDTDAADVACLVAEVSEATDSMETRLLRLVREAAHGAVAADDLSNELSYMADELQRCYRRLAEAEDRRDVRFPTVLKLDQLKGQCLWLYRKIHLEQAFYTKLELEARLRASISREGYALYQQILCVEDGERRLLGQSDADLRRALLGTT
jgi:hypothetical protein